jgi:hypothetical protein
MLEFLKAIPQIIAEAAKKPLGTLALMVLLIFFIAFNFFNNEDAIVKIIVFGVLFCGILLFGLSMYQTGGVKKVKQSGQARPTTYSKSKFLIVALIFCSLTALTLYNLFWQPHVAYFKEVRRTQKCWQGHIRMSKEQSLHCGSYYKITYNGSIGLPKTIECLNGSGGIVRSGIKDTIANMLIKECADIKAVKLNFDYDENGNILRENYIDPAGRLLLKGIYSEHASVLRFEYDETSCSKVNTNIRAVKLAYVKGADRTMLLKSMHFYNDRQKPMPNEHKIFGFAYAYDQNDNVLSVKSLNTGGSRCKDVTQYKYDKKGRVVEESYWSASEEKILKRGVHKCLYEWDANNNELSDAYFNDTDEKTYCYAGYFKVIFAYDDKGNNLLEKYLGLDQRPINTNNAAYTKHEFDRKGQDTVLSFLDTKGKPAYINYGYHKRVIKYDEYERVVAQSHFDGSNKPINYIEGYHKQEIIYNASGYMSELRYLDKNGRLVYNWTGGGGAATQNKFDRNNNIYEIDHLGTDREPIYRYELKSNCPAGYTTIKFEHDEQGHETQRTYIDKLGQPAYLCQSDGNHFHINRSYYDQFGNCIREEYLDENKKFIDNFFAICENKYDERCRIVKAILYESPNVYLDDAGYRPFMNTYYNDLDQVVKTEWCNKKGKPITINTKAYDIYGNLSRLSYFDSLKNMTWSKAYVYNRLQKVIKETTYDKNNSPVDGSAIVEKSYDVHGYLVREKYLDKNSNPILNSENYATRLIQNDNYGNMILETFIGVKGERILNSNKVHQAKYKYDRNNLINEISYVDTNFKPTLSAEGITRVLKKRDWHTQVIEESYYGTDGRPIKDPETGCEVFRISYDERGFMLSRSFHDHNGTLINNTFGTATIKEVRTKDNILREKYYFDKDNKPINSKLGFHKTLYKYSRAMVPTEEHYTVDGKLVPNKPQPK